jgi:ABC-type dipeptide/oligopeptide/nickel transport system permease component
VAASFAADPGDPDHHRGLIAVAHLAPGDPSTVPLQQCQVIENLRRVYGLDQPLPVQFVKWFTTFWTFPWDPTAWGYSITDGQPVRDKIFERIPSTLQLMGTALFLTIVIAIPVILGAVKQYSIADRRCGVATITCALTFCLHHPSPDLRPAAGPLPALRQELLRPGG